jgi:uncharacterized membrane protein YeaQ/YmgE (transglycosylase-associated protein family)
MDFTNVAIWIIIGAITGWLASIVMKTNRSQAKLANSMVGIVGGLIGGWLLTVIDQEDEFIVSGYVPGTLLAALVGTVIALALWNLLKYVLAARKTP